MAKAKESFEQWMAEVDAAVIKKIGLSIHDLPDCCFHDWYNDGVTPKSAAAKAIKECNE